MRNPVYEENGKDLRPIEEETNQENGFPRRHTESIEEIRKMFEIPC